MFHKKATKARDQQGKRVEAKATTTTIEANLDKVRPQFLSLIIPDRSSVAGSQSPIPIAAPESNKVENSTAIISNSTISSNNSTTSVTGTKKVLSATRNLLERVSKLLVKFVHKIFPWNRRARRRVMGDGDDEEL